MDQILCNAESYRQQIGEEFLITLSTGTVPSGTSPIPVSSRDWLSILRDEIHRVGVAKELADEMELKEVQADGHPCMGCEYDTDGPCNIQCKRFSNYSSGD